MKRVIPRPSKDTVYIDKVSPKKLYLANINNVYYAIRRDGSVYAAYRHDGYRESVKLTWRYTLEALIADLLKSYTIYEFSSKLMRNQFIQNNS